MSSGLSCRTFFEIASSRTVNFGSHTIHLNDKSERECDRNFALCPPGEDGPSRTRYISCSRKSTSMTAFLSATAKPPSPEKRTSGHGQGHGNRWPSHGGDEGQAADGCALSVGVDHIGHINHLERHPSFSGPFHGTRVPDEPEDSRDRASYPRFMQRHFPGAAALGTTGFQRVDSSTSWASFSATRIFFFPSPWRNGTGTGRRNGPFGHLGKPRVPTEPGATPPRR